MSLNHFIELLKQHNEVIEIHNPVSTELEISEITDRISKSEKHNKALIFYNNGTSFPLLINAFGSEKRMALALHSQSLLEAEQKIEQIFEWMYLPSTLADKMRLAHRAIKLSSWLPRYSKRKGKCQEVVHLNPDLSTLPILKCWPHDGGRFITLPMVHTYIPEEKQLNIGMYRMQVFSQNTTGMHWHIHKTGAIHYTEAKQKDRKIPIAVCLGGDPVYTYCATAPLPHGINEYILAGVLRQKAVNLVPCITQNIYVPEDVDIVIEGYVDPNEPLVSEGPFGDHTGFYSLPDYYPLFHVTAITHQKKAIYPTTIVGIPPQEDYWFIKASERIFLPFLKHTLLHEVIDMQMPAYGVAHNLVLVQIKNLYPRHANKVANALWGIGQMMLNKILIITDLQLNNTLFERIKNTSWKNRLMLSYGPMDALEHAGLKPLEGGKLMMDATSMNNTHLISYNDQLFQILKRFFEPHHITYSQRSYNIFIVFANKLSSFDFNKLLTLLNENNIEGEVRIFILQKELYGLSTTDWAWHFLANFDPSNDLKVLSLNHLDILIFDGRIKKIQNKKIPNPTIMSDTIIEKVNQRWNQFFNLPFITSPSEKYQRLFFGETYFVEF